MKKLFAILLALIMVFSLVACAAEETPAEPGDVATEEQPPAASEDKAPEAQDAPVATGDLPVVTTLGLDAIMPSGTVTGWRGDAIAKFAGVQQNVIPFAEDKRTAMIQTGELPDIMYVNQHEIAELIEAGLLLNLDEYKDQLPHLYSNPCMQSAIDAHLAKTPEANGSLYGIPLQSGPKAFTSSTLQVDGAQVPRVRWDVYKQIGCPEVNNLWELLDVMEQMVEAVPEIDGQKTYGMALDSEIETWHKSFINHGWFMEFNGQGTTPRYLIEYDLVTGDVRPTMSKDSYFYEGMEWLFEANQRGLIDPDSMSYDYATATAMNVEYGMATTTIAVVGPPQFMEIVVDETKVVIDDVLETGNGVFLAITSSCKDVDSALKLLDFYCNPDALLEYHYGPEGEIWELDAEGNLQHTEEGLACLLETGDYSTYVFSSGENWNYYNMGMPCYFGVETSYGDGEGGKAFWYLPALESANRARLELDPTYAEWSEFSGYSSLTEWLEAEDKVHYLDMSSFAFPIPEDAMQLQVDAIGNIITPACWKMMFASDRAEFDALWDQMVADVNENGGEEIYQWAADYAVEWFANNR